MRRSRFSVEQIVAVLKQAELGMAVPELIRKIGISEQTFCRWKKRYAGQGQLMTGSSRMELHARRPKPAIRKRAEAGLSSTAGRTGCGRLPVATNGCSPDAKRDQDTVERKAALEKHDGRVWVGSATSLNQSADVRVA